MSYEVYALELENGARLGIGPLPSTSDIELVRAWGPGAVVSLSTAQEMEGLDLRGAFGALWHHLPIADFGIPEREADWQKLSPKLHAILDEGGGVFAHCLGGKGRSGLVLLRLMVERGWDGEDALKQLRSIRPGAVETEAQRLWAIKAD